MEKDCHNKVQNLQTAAVQGGMEKDRDNKVQNVQTAAVQDGVVCSHDLSMLTQRATGLLGRRLQILMFATPGETGSSRIC